MRDFRFRAWDKEESKILYFPFMYVTYYGAELVFDSDKDSNYIDTNPEENQHKYVLMQYTGLKDKNGKEIYEGDVLEFSSFDEGELKEQVYFDRGYYQTITGPLALFSFPIEIIGNIYENPELLK